MAQDQNRLAKEGMRFFGKLSASSTHEIKNALAIINENAGLMGDLSLSSGKGGCLSPERINRIAAKIEKNVKRADNILKRLNKFSHSVDLDSQVVDLGETLSFIVDFASRLIEQHGTAIEINMPDSPVLLDTNLFFLENMLFRGIETACSMAGGPEKISISVGKDSSRPLIWFSMCCFADSVKHNMEDNSMDDWFVSENDITLIEHLGISVEKDIKNNSFGFLWPERI